MRDLRLFDQLEEEIMVMRMDRIEGNAEGVHYRVERARKLLEKIQSEVFWAKNRSGEGVVK